MSETTTPTTPATQPQKNAALDLAVRRGNVKAAQSLIDEGADPNYIPDTPNAESLLLVAFQKRDQAMVEMLLALPSIDVNKGSNNPHFKQVLMKALRGPLGYLYIADPRVDINYPQKGGWPMVFISCHPQFTPHCMKELFMCDKDVQTTTDHPLTHEKVSCEEILVNMTDSLDPKESPEILNAVQEKLQLVREYHQNKELLRSRLRLESAEAKRKRSEDSKDMDEKLMTLMLLRGLMGKK